MDNKKQGCNIATADTTEGGMKVTKEKRTSPGERLHQYLAEHRKPSKSRHRRPSTLRNATLKRMEWQDVHGQWHKENLKGQLIEVVASEDKEAIFWAKAMGHKVYGIDSLWVLNWRVAE